jgi:hypothetical protein
MAAANIQLQGFVAANRDAVVHLTQEATGETISRQPFLDGSLLIRDVDPGFYQLQVTHPNLLTPIDTRRIRIFPQPAPTFIPIPVPADLFTDTPIRDIPDADLGPVQQAATAVKSSLAPIASKGPGEAIRAADWNTLASGVMDLATAVMTLTTLVSPIGHAHPEIEEKIGEVQENIRRFAEAFGRSLLELRRELETAYLRQYTIETLDLAQAPAQVRTDALARIDDLQATTQADTPTFTQKLAATGNVLLAQVNDLAVAQGAGADDFRAQPTVKALVDSARNYSEAGTQIKAESELQTYQRTTTAAGPKLIGLLGARRAVNGNA